MKFSVPKCPHCGTPVSGVLERLLATASLSFDEAEGTFDYAGDSKVHWDSQEMDLDSDKEVTVYCEEGCEWQTKVSE